MRGPRVQRIEMDVADRGEKVGFRFDGGAKAPGKQPDVVFLGKRAEPFDETQTVLVVFEQPASPRSLRCDMVYAAVRFSTGLSRHVGSCPRRYSRCRDYCTMGGVVLGKEGLCPRIQNETSSPSPCLIPPAGRGVPLVDFQRRGNACARMRFYLEYENSRGLPLCPF